MTATVAYTAHDIKELAQNIADTSHEWAGAVVAHSMVFVPCPYGKNSDEWQFYRALVTFAGNVEVI